MENKKLTMGGQIDRQAFPAKTVTALGRSCRVAADHYETLTALTVNGVKRFP
ncbi:hypothetical protein [uncultured Maricaulis sp.]|uniref:hypothetical protein n=1 Tax=uncultured Maricaulis sp. TaxID=174710 RepID=UPI002605E1A0|nr:hypothetical protein [uncultured Maricaulis sp.]